MTSLRDPAFREDVDPSMLHYVRKGARLQPPYPAGLSQAFLASGCFWGSEKGFWRLPGVYSTVVGYIAGQTADPTYREVCSGQTGHTEGCSVVWDPAQISFADILRQFWASHDPTQGNRQGGDRGTQYRSGIYCLTEEQLALAEASKTAFEKALGEKGYGRITTEILLVDPKETPFWFAEDYHQQYLAKPGNRQYCSAEPTGIPVPAGGLESGDANLSPLLPEAFWAQYDGSLRAPHEPVAGDPAAWDKAAAAKAKAAEDAEAAAAALEADNRVVIRYCGGCGYEKRATSLQGMLADATGATVGLQREEGITGNFEVRVRPDAKDAAFEVVHSKKKAEGKGDGFVDTEKKFQKIVDAVAAGGESSSL